MEKRMYIETGGTADKMLKAREAMTSALVKWREGASATVILNEVYTAMGELKQAIARLEAQRDK